MINEELKVKVDEHLLNIFLAEDVNGVEDVRIMNNSQNGYERNVESSYVDYVKDFNNEDGDSEFEYLPKTASGVGDGSGLVMEEEKSEGKSNQAIEEYGLDKENNYSLGKKKHLMGIKEGTMETY